MTRSWNLKKTPLSEIYYKNVIVYDLILKQNYSSIMELPRVEKIVINTTSKLYSHEKKHLVLTLAALELISGQKPQVTCARKSIANFKIREHQLLGCRVSLREKLMYSFLEKLSKIVFPRVRDDFKNKKQTHSVCFGFQNVMIFPELETQYSIVEQFRGMDINFVVSHPKSSCLVLSGFQFPVSREFECF